jgi:hypothetical protein
VLLALRSFDEAAEEGPGAMESGAYRSDRASHDIGNFLITVLFKVCEDDHLTLLGGELSEGSR